MEQDNEEVRQRTNFKSLNHLLAYSILLCNGDHDKMIHKTSKLTWLEEWFFFYEYTWGRTIVRWWDAEKEMKIHRNSLQRIFQYKLGVAKACRQSWPHYASYNEDHALMKQKWMDKYKEQRVVMWDDTNINLAFQPSGTDEQRFTYSM